MKKITFLLLTLIGFLFVVININTVSKEELQTLKNIGEKSL